MHDLAANTVQDGPASRANLVSLCIQSTHKVITEMTGGAGDEYPVTHSYAACHQPWKLMGR
jgi:hypothetical protein